MADVEVEVAPAPADEMAAVSTLLDSCYAQVMATIYKGNVEPTDIIVIVATAMQIVQKQGQLSGAQKKELVIGIMNKIITQSGLVDPKDQAACLLILNTAVPIAIDTIVSAFQGKIDLTKPVKAVKNGCCAVM